MCSFLATLALADGISEKQVSKSLRKQLSDEIVFIFLNCIEQCVEDLHKKLTQGMGKGS